MSLSIEIMSQIYEQEIVAMNKVLEKFREHPWVVLVAPMQSGKTNTFKTVACEMLRTGRVKHVVVFSGNRETDLRDQTTDHDEFRKGYRKYLRANHGFSADESDEGDSWVNKIEVVWGQDLKKHVVEGDTLYIWEESHAAQSVNQEVDKFMRRMGIQATGKVPEGSYFLSVSATPFSELSDIYHLEQNKAVVRLIPSEQYRSVGKMHRNGQIRTLIDIRKEFAEILVTDSDPSYVLVRAQSKMQQNLSQIATEAGYDIVCCDMTVNPDLNLILGKKPDKNTVIFLKGKCRMGKRIIKTYLRAGIETSKKINTDTLLQGLLGRCCGYDSRDDIIIYVACLNLVELERFIALSEGDLTAIPSRAMNMSKGREIKTRVPIKPIRIPLDEDPEACIARGILQSFDSFEHQNTDETMEIVLSTIRKIAEASAKIKTERSKEERKLARRLVRHKSGNVYKEALPKVRDAWTNGIECCEFGSGAGACATEDEVVVWVDKKCLYITMQIEHLTLERQHIVPKTNKREIFCKEREYGGVTFLVSPSTRNDPIEFEKCLDSLIEASRELGSPTLTSNGHGEFLLLSDEVFDYLQTVVVPKWNAQGIIISFKKVTGRKPKGVSDVRLSEITWKIPGLPFGALACIAASEQFNLE